MELGIVYIPIQGLNSLSVNNNDNPIGNFLTLYKGEMTVNILKVCSNRYLDILFFSWVKVLHVTNLDTRKYFRR